ncbi:right-handed parallel beta-helix repeat-containing protein [Thermopolyspora sp. NPDC052614]|uniref:right-handed parallel beta-helix repeat-containing protein n=1 Tax=Thermopolyspora sp. NPDC052614 TaxID=3155682 RepID=UPI00343ACE02
MKVLRFVFVTLVMLLAIPATVVPAAALACTGQFRYASSTNTIYLESGTATLTDIATACPNAPLTSPSPGVWELSGDLSVTNGATLVLQGVSKGGDVNLLRLRSAASALATEVSSIMAKYGTILVEGVTITSWDPATGGPDTDPHIPAGAPADARGRAFIRVISYMDGATPRESRMDVVDSDLGYLGYYAAESYGVSYKARGCDAANIPICDALNVYGKQINSRFHHNYFGVYTYNAYGMDFIDSEYDHNIAYGLDPHDDSDHLTITGNKFHHNGNHGLICSQRCDHLLIADNESYSNGIPPYIPEGDDDPSDNQVHGIMLHRGVIDTIVENNVVTDHPNGAGIAIFDSVGNVVRNNRITGAEYGLRYSVGTRDAETTGNVVTDSLKYAVFTYKGSDLPTYTGTSGRPANLLFSGNTFDGAESNIVKINDADGVRFAGNTFTGSMSNSRMQNSTATTFAGNTQPSSLAHATFGSPATASSTVFEQITTPVRASVDSNSSIVFTNTDGTVYGGATRTSLTPSGGTLTLTSAQIGTSTVTVSPTQVKAVPASGSVAARVTGSVTSVLHVQVTGPAGLPVAYTIAGLTPGTTYRVTRGGTTVATATASPSGVMTFTAAAPAPTEVDYAISAVPA